MQLHLLPDRASLCAAIAMLPEPARDAAQTLAHRIATAPSMLHDTNRLNAEWLQACAIACGRAGLRLPQDAEAIERFMETYGAAVLNIAASVITVQAAEVKRRRVFGWMGKGATIAAGIAIGAFFG